MNFTPAQIDISLPPLNKKIFLSGPAGTGKTTAAVARLRALLNEGVRADSILVLTPQSYFQMIQARRAGSAA